MIVVRISILLVPDYSYLTSHSPIPPGHPPRTIIPTNPTSPLTPTIPIAPKNYPYIPSPPTLIPKFIFCCCFSISFQENIRKLPPATVGKRWVFQCQSTPVPILHQSRSIRMWSDIRFYNNRDAVILYDQPLEVPNGHYNSDVTLYWFQCGSFTIVPFAFLTRALFMSSSLWNPVIPFSGVYPDCG